VLRSGTALTPATICFGFAVIWRRSGLLLDPQADLDDLASSKLDDLI